MTSFLQLLALLSRLTRAPLLDVVLDLLQRLYHLPASDGSVTVSESVGNSAVLSPGS